MPTNIPIFINNLNRLSTTKQLVFDLERLGYRNITILDNNSTYQPLIEWYEWSGVKVIPLHRNLGQLAIYNSGVLKEVKNPWVAYTDSDIELSPNTPINFLETMVGLAGKYGTNKAGLALRIDDLPDNKFSDIFREWEAKYWSTPLEPNVYKAHVDTTFCVLKTSAPFDYDAIRIGGDFTCRHLPWYTDFGHLTPEEKYYLDNVNIEYSGYRRYYNMWLKDNEKIP